MFTLVPRQIHRNLAKSMFEQWLRGKTYEEIGAANNLPADKVHQIITAHLKIARQTWNKWRLAEIRCHALAMELRLLRIGKEAEPDRPIETLDPPEHWLDAFKRAGIDTVNQLRAVDSETLYAKWKFPVGAIVWAVLKLDKLGLSHVLEKRARKPRPKLSSRPVLPPGTRLYRRD